MIFPPAAGSLMLQCPNQVSQDSFNGASIKGDHEVLWHLHFLTCGIQALLDFFSSDAVIFVQERSSEICTPQKLVLLTLSTVEPLIISGDCSPEVNNNLLGFVYIKEKTVVTAPHCQMFHLIHVVRLTIAVSSPNLKKKTGAVFWCAVVGY